MVDVARVAESEGDTTENQGDDQGNSRNSPAGSQSTPHESVSNDHLPTNLQVESQRPQEHPHHTTPPPGHQKGTRKGAGRAGAHIIGGDCVEALLGFCSKGNDETKLKLRISKHGARTHLLDYLPAS